MFANNKIIIENFQQLIVTLQDDKKSNNKFKITSFRKVIRIIKDYPDEIISAEQLKDIKGIGKGTLKRIDEILTMGGLESVKNYASSTENIMNLQRINGVGPANAQKLHKNGTTLEKLLREVKDGFVPDLESCVMAEIKNNRIPKISKLLSELTHHQYLGLKYFDETEQRIPHKEIDKIIVLMRKYINGDLSFTVCGSYRRGCATSGDIDVLLTHRSIIRNEELQKSKHNYLSKIVLLLANAGFLVDHLTANGNTKYMGYCRLGPNATTRRIDIRFVSYNSYYPAMLYFTGSKRFNQEMRTHALKKGYTLNEYGLFEVSGYETSGKIIKGNKIVTHCEKDIFDIIEFEYVEPNQRDI